MPNSIVSEGKTTNEAIENGLKELGVQKNQVDVKVLENEDKRSFFSILTPRIVKVELTVKENSEKNFKQERVIKEEREYTEEEIEEAEKSVKKFMDEFLNKVADGANYEISKNEKGIEVSVKGENATYLIGYRGEVLYSIQNILSVIASKGLETKVRVILDIEGYKDKREKTLEELAEKVAKTVIRTGKSVTLEPMKAYERKIIHTKLQGSDKVTTTSIGEEPRRRIVISLK